MKHALFAASLVLVAGAAFGCGDDGNSGGDQGSAAPAAATEEEFCDSFTSLSQDIGEAVDDDDQSALIEQVKEATSAMQEVGTPDDIPDDAREGFEIFVDTIDDVDADASEAELEEIGGDLSAEDEAKFEAFGTYVTTTCVPEAPSAPSAPESSPAA